MRESSSRWSSTSKALCPRCCTSSSKLSSDVDFSLGKDHVFSSAVGLVAIFSFPFPFPFIRHSIYSSMHPDTMLILYFIRCHTTVTIMLLFIFFTKVSILDHLTDHFDGNARVLGVNSNLFVLFVCLQLCFLLKPNSEEYCRTSRLSTIDGNDLTNNTDSGKCQPSHLVGNAEFELAGGELNLVEMEPEEIRVSHPETPSCLLWRPLGSFC